MQGRIQSVLARLPFFWRYSRVFKPRFRGTADYWEIRYVKGGNSGCGSYGNLARFTGASRIMSQDAFPDGVFGKRSRRNIR